MAARFRVVSDRRGRRQARLLARVDGHALVPPGWQTEPTNLEELVLSYLRAPDDPPALPPAPEPRAVAS